MENNFNAYFGTYALITGIANDSKGKKNTFVDTSGNTVQIPGVILHAKQTNFSLTICKFSTIFARDEQAEINIWKRLPEFKRNNNGYIILNCSSHTNNWLKISKIKCAYYTPKYFFNCSYLKIQVIVFISE